MKKIHQLLFICGTGLFAYGLVMWAKSGFYINIENLATMLFSTKPWNLDKEGYFFFVVLGGVLAAYSAIELNLKRWESDK